MIGGQRRIGGSCGYRHEITFFVANIVSFLVVPAYASHVTDVVTQQRNQKVEPVAGANAAFLGVFSAQDLLAYQYWRSYQLHVVRTRGFNHTGPRRGEVFVTSNFARQVAEIEKGIREPVVHVGNLESIRDFTDVRDMVRAYWLALERGEAGEVYNICSGRGYSAQQVLDILLGLAHVKVKVQQDPDRMRPSDVTLLLGDCSKFQSATGWEPTIPFEVTLKDLLEHWRKRV